MIPLIVGWSHFPEYKGRVAGIILSGFGLGPFLFNPMMTYFINPSNKPAVLQISSENYFEPEVAEKFPSSLYLVMSFIILFNIIGILLLFSPASPAVDQNENQRQDNFSKVLKSKVFWQLAFMIFFSVSGDFYIVGNFKVFGKEYIEDDMFLALVGSFSSLIDACSRSLWGYLFDKTSFKIVYSLILTLQFFTYLMLIYLAQSKVVYFFCMMVFFSMTGVHYVLFTAITSRLFGNDGHKVFAVLCYFFALGTFFSNLMHKLFFKYIGYSSLFFIFAGMNGISGILLLLYEEKIENHELAVELIEKNKENL
jgi:predicted MFS family arabinose efflux permease